MAARRFRFAAAAGAAQTRFFFWNTRTILGVGSGKDSATSRDSRLNDLARVFTSREI